MTQGNESEPNHYPAFLGIDVGTSGIRAIVIDHQNAVLASNMRDMPAPTQPQANFSEQDPFIWKQTLHAVLSDLSRQFDFQRVMAVSVDATSGTVLLTNPQGEPLTTGLMYNDQRAVEYVEQIKQLAPEGSPTCSASSGLAKALWLLDNTAQTDTPYLSHQADWLAGLLTQQFHHTDSNNALKSGYDPIIQDWPQWLEKLNTHALQLPKVSRLGTVLCGLSEETIQKYGFNPAVQFVSGTTDSTAALMATGATRIGDAVTSLGSSLVLKIISEQPVYSNKEGIYSQPFGEHWLVGGASNTGGAVLRHYFSDMQMAQLEPQLQLSKPTRLNYYPLLQTGERFPNNNPQQEARLSPRPENDALFFQAILEGITSIEQQGYQKLQQLGAPAPKRLFSVGGGTKNSVWTNMRHQALNIPMQKALNSHAAFGTALIAKQGYDNQQQ